MATIPYFGISPSSVVLILLFLGLALFFRRRRVQYRPKHLEQPLRNDIKAPKQDVRIDSGPQAHTTKTTGLAAKPSLLEAIGWANLREGDNRAVCERVVDYLARFFRAEIVLCLTAQAGNFYVAAAKGAGENGQLADLVYPIEGSLAASLAEDTPVNCLNIPNISLDNSLGFNDPLIAALADVGANSLLLAAVGRSCALALGGRRPDSFTKIDEAAINSVAFQLTYLFAVRDKEDRLKGSIDELNNLFDIINQMQSSEDLQESLRKALETAVGLSGAKSGSFLIHDEAERKLRLQAAVGLSESATAVEIGLGEGIAGWVGIHRKPVMIKDLHGQEASRSGLGQDQVAAAVSLPVTLGEKLVGVLNLGSARTDHDFAVRNLEQVLRLLGQIGGTINKSQSDDEWHDLFINTIKALIRTVEARDPFSHDHSVQVSGLAARLVQELRLSPAEVETVEIAGLLHDVGVAAISDAYFAQERPLSSVERLLIRSHPRLGAKAIAEIKRLKDAVPLILHHHENFDGSGYPQGLAGDEIPIGARALSVAEAYIAMTAERPYRPAKSKNEAIDELRRLSGTQFDPQIVYTFCRLLESAGPEGSLISDQSSGENPLY